LRKVRPMPIVATLADEREAELENAARTIGGRRRKARGDELGHHVVEVHLHEGRQQEAVVQAGCPSA